jgi:hypothetical protein
MARGVEKRRTIFFEIIKLIVVFCLGAIAVLLAQLVVNGTRSHTVQNPPSHPITAEKKPCGDLEITSIPFENSETVFLDGAARLKPPEWVFDNATPAELIPLFQTLDLTEAQRRELLATNSWKIHSNYCAIYPSDTLRLGINAATRAKIYGTLAQCQSNYSQCFPFRFAPNRFEERFSRTRISRDTEQFVRGLCYTNDDLLSFADLDLAKNKLSPDEFTALIELLYSVPTVRLRLRVGPNTDIEPLIKYWGKGGREHRVRPMLESIAHLPGGDSIAIPYLLPGVARLRLYTFPDTTRDPIGPREDCFFTALNFFNRNADEKFLDKENNRKALLNNYTPVRDQPTYGDLITLVNGRGDALHVAVYIAEDVVFTKNGGSMLQPWVLMRMDDMMAYFPSREPLQIAIFRKKEFAEPTASVR